MYFYRILDSRCLIGFCMTFSDILLFCIPLMTWTHRNKGRVEQGIELEDWRWEIEKK